MYQWLQRLFGDKPREAPAPEPAQKLDHQVLAAKVQAVQEQRQQVAAPPAASASPAATPKPVPAAQAKPAKGEAWGASWEQRSDVNANFHDWLFEGGDGEFDITPIEAEILEALDKIVKGKQSGANLVKRMPGVIPQLLQSLRTENFSGADISRKIAHDVVLVAAVIRLANSSMYNPQAQITSIENAVLVLGYNGLRQLITGVAFRPIIDLHSGMYTKMSAPRVWEQSEYCAVACRMLAEERHADPFEAFLAGLVQQVGLVVGLRIIDQVCQQPGSKAGRVGTSPFCSNLMKMTRSLSCSIAREWNFPENVILALEDQNQFQSAQMSETGKVLALGDYLSKLFLLSREQRVAAGDPRILKGLSENARATYAELQNVEVFDPAAQEAKG
ncbi:HDOD domain-containing protein [Massilia sp. W12]|uniref:HDOD domain-containing protein n=1 Tax=Massilia sp. W12 TaxID=3126507 RepID=UPI0030CBAD90